MRRSLELMKQVMDYRKLAEDMSYEDLTKFIKEYVRIGWKEYAEFHNLSREERNTEERGDEFECYKDVFALNIKYILEEI